MSSEREAYDELYCYTIDRGDASFVLQHVVDAFSAQRANEQSKPIGVTFALVGLYLHVERQFTGRQVQLAHMQLARKKQQWPAFVLPVNRGSMTAIDVMAAPAGPQRDAAIHAWCASVWEAFAQNRQAAVDLLRQHGMV